MNGQRALQAVSSPAEQPNRRTHRVYTVTEICGFLKCSRRTFFELRLKGQLPWCQELKPRAGRLIRYRADLVDRYLAGQWHTSRFFASHVRKPLAVRSGNRSNSLAMGDR